MPRYLDVHLSPRFHRTALKGAMFLRVCRSAATIVFCSEVDGFAHNVTITIIFSD